MSKVCVRCGHENADHSYYCGKCTTELPKPVFQPSADHAPSVQDLGSRHRLCVACGRSISFDAVFCPYCGYDFSWSPVQRQETVSSEMRVLFYILSVLVPLAGIIIGVLFMVRPEPDYNHVGKICLIIGVVCGVIAPIIVAAIWFSVFLTF